MPSTDTQFTYNTKFTVIHNSLTLINDDFHTGKFFSQLHGPLISLLGLKKKMNKFVGHKIGKFVDPGSQTLNFP